MSLRRVLWYTIVLMLFASAGVWAEERPDSTVADASTSGPPPIRWYSMFSNIPGDWVRYTKVTFRTRNIPAMIGITALTGALMATDADTWRMSDKLYQRSSFVRSSSDFFEYMGDGRPQFGLSAGFALYGLVASDGRAVRTASQLVEAILACGVVVQTLKHITGRESPFVSTAPAGRWRFFPNQIEYHKHVPAFDAYPSGHVATALATVTVVAENYPEWVWVRPVGYVLVGCIAVAMGNTGIHWYSDYPLGLALGYGFGMLAAHPEGLESEHESGEEESKFSIGPVFTGGHPGLAIMLTL